MIVQIYRNTTEGVKTCEGEYFEHEGFKFCIAAIEYGDKFIIYAIEYTTGFDAIPSKTDYIYHRRNIRKGVEEVKEVLKTIDKYELTTRINKAKNSHYCRAKYPLNK